MIVSDLKDIDLFSDLTEDQLAQDIVGELIELKHGEVLFNEGEDAQCIFIILDGTLEVYRNINGQKLIINTFSKGMSFGEVPLLSGSPHLANGIALTDLRLFKIKENDFWCMLSNCVSIRKKVLQNMSERSKDLNQLSFHREKLVSLGTMAAGLAHELNNPASAAKRTADGISKTLQQFNLNSSEMLKWHIFRDEVNKKGYPFQPIKDIIQIEGVKLDPIERDRLEDELADWLEEIGLDEPLEAASILVLVGFTKDSLAKFSELLVASQVVNFIKWLSKDLEMRVLSRELLESTKRISDLVTAMKSYSYMDKPHEKSMIDLHKGIDDTLIILNHKLKQNNVVIDKQYDKTIPKLTAYGSELNQVWTNFIHNAIDAVEDEGIITIKTSMNQNNTVSVEIIDNGKGIPKDIQDKIFDPFFTTKAPGEGTGLGLEISHRIIVNQHAGSIDLYSEPGLTKFIINLPLNQ